MKDMNGVELKVGDRARRPEWDPPLLGTVISPGAAPGWIRVRLDPESQVRCGCGESDTNASMWERVDPEKKAETCEACGASPAPHAWPAVGTLNRALAGALVCNTCFMAKSSALVEAAIHGNRAARRVENGILETQTWLVNVVKELTGKSVTGQSCNGDGGWLLLVECGTYGRTIYVDQKSGTAMHEKKDVYWVNNWLSANKIDLKPKPKATAPSDYVCEDCGMRTSDQAHKAGQKNHRGHCQVWLETKQRDGWKDDPGAEVHRTSPGDYTISIGGMSAPIQIMNAAEAAKLYGAGTTVAGAVGADFAKLRESVKAAMPLKLAEFEMLLEDALGQKLPKGVRIVVDNVSCHPTTDEPGKDRYRESYVCLIVGPDGSTLAECDVPAEYDLEAARAYVNETREGLLDSVARAIMAREREPVRPPKRVTL